MSRACWRISAAALGSGRPISKRRQSSSCSDDSGITLSAHTKLCVTRACVKMFQEEPPRRVQLPVLFRRGVRFVSGGCCWVAIHSACSASLSHSRISSSKPALRVGSRVSCPRCSARLACSRYHCALDSMQIEHARTKAVPGTSRIGAALFRWTLGFSPSPQHSPGSRNPALRSPSVAGFRQVSVQASQSEIFVIPSRKQFVVEGPLNWCSAWNRAIAAAQEGGRNDRYWSGVTHCRDYGVQRHHGHLYRSIESESRRSRSCAHT